MKKSIQLFKNEQIPTASVSEIVKTTNIEQSFNLNSTDDLLFSPEKKPGRLPAKKYNLAIPILKPSNETIEKSELYTNFKSGDFIYGLQPVRAVYLPALKEKTGAGMPVIIDMINQEVIISDIQEERSVYAKEYLSYLQSTKYFLAKKNLIKGDEENIRIRNSCKAAINWPGRTIHFCLDKIDIEPNVLAKYNPKNAKIDYGFTIAELRWIYRHQHELKNQVIFYKDGKQWLAPWEENPELWGKKYQRKPQEKLEWLKKNYPDFEYSIPQIENKKEFTNKRTTLLFNSKLFKTKIKNQKNIDNKDEVENSPPTKLAKFN